MNELNKGSVFGIKINCTKVRFLTPVKDILLPVDSVVLGDAV